MSSIKLFKKEINNRIGSFIEEVYAWELNHPDADIKSTEKLIDKAIIDKEQELVTEELKNSGKPEEIAKKISLGKMNKFKEENALLTQAWVMEPKKKSSRCIKRTCY